MLLADVWDQICRDAAEGYRTEILDNVKALRVDLSSAPADPAYRRLDQVSETHRRLLGFSAADYRMWLVGFRQSAVGSGRERFRPPTGL